MNTRRPDPQASTRKDFQWQISSASIDFMHGEEARAARDGCGGNDCSMVSPLPTPRREPLEPDPGRK